MYLKPGNLYKDFTIVDKSSTTGSYGRVVPAFTPGKTLSGILADAKPEEKERYKQMTHPITHTIIQKGSPVLEAEDKLTYSGRNFHVQGVDNIGALGIWTIYFVEERK